jgi:hypothetical protein
VPEIRRPTGTLGFGMAAFGHDEPTGHGDRIVQAATLIGAFETLLGHASGNEELRIVLGALENGRVTVELALARGKELQAEDATSSG